MEEGYGSIEVENLLSNSEDRNENNHETRQTSLFQTISNIIKLCIGSGVLALPYAVNEAGLVCHVVGLSLVTLWNIYSTDRLIKCREYMQEFRYYMKRAESFSSADDSYSSKTSTESQRASLHQSEEHVTLHQNMSSELAEDANTGTLGKVSLFAFGKVGLHAIDSVMMILMFGIIIAYEDAILGFVQATPATTGSKNLDAILMLLIIIPLASLSDFSSIAKVAALGTVVLFIIFISIGYYGLNENGLQGFESISDQNLWPSSFSAISSWYGIVVFGFGSVPFTYNIQDAMKHPNQILKATNISLWIVFMTYAVMGDILSIIFWPSLHGFKTDMISILPNNATFPTILRLSMTLVILTTAPLIIVPTGDLIVNKFGLINSSSGSMSSKIGMMLRITICIFCAFVSVFVPNFVYVISFVGCCLGSFISFVYPPLIHIKCLFKVKKLQTKNHSSQKYTIVLDVILLLIGLISCFVTSNLTLQIMIKNIERQSAAT
mmetsp:Transcript_9130/g.10577  ORF Transcript_9130/g.10577 Transcript_9130/m.10577 type:complete len:493 (+) Transcript_9130:123-1601(+)